MKRIEIVDILKGIAILAVVYDHASYFYPLFYNPVLKDHVMFSIIWFIFLSGFINAKSADKHNLKTPKNILVFYKKRIGSIFPLYIIASLFTYLILFRGISLSEFTMRILNFRMAAPFYFVNLILGLYIAFPFLYICLKFLKKRVYFLIPFVSLILLSSFVITPIKMKPWYYMVTDIYLGWGYVLPFILGMLVSFYPLLLKKASLLLFSFIFILCEAYHFIYQVPFLAESIPTLYYFVWSVTFMAPLFLIIEAQKLKLGFLVYLGRKSYSIFLFHNPIMQYGTILFPGADLPISIAAVLVSVLFPILLENTLNTLYSMVRSK